MASFPVEIDFHGCPSSEAARELIELHLIYLEKSFCHIAAARIAIIVPGSYSRDQLFEIHVHLLLPGGKAIDATGIPSQKERFLHLPLFSRLPFAINNAFVRARRQLQDIANCHRPRGKRQR